MNEALIISGPGAALVAALTFGGTYSLLPWRRSMWGRMMMLTMAATALLSASYVMARLDELSEIDLWPVHGWGRSIAWWLLAAVYAWKIAQVVSAIRDDGRDGPLCLEAEREHRMNGDDTTLEPDELPDGAGEAAPDELSARRDGNDSEEVIG